MTAPNEVPHNLFQYEIEGRVARLRIEFKFRKRKYAFECNVAKFATLEAAERSLIELKHIVCAKQRQRDREYIGLRNGSHKAMAIIRETIEAAKAKYGNEWGNQQAMRQKAEQMAAVRAEQARQDVAAVRLRYGLPIQRDVYCNAFGEQTPLSGF